MPATAEYRKKASRIMRAEMTRRGIRYAELARRLRELGADETEQTLMSKISRGTFQAALFLMCMKAMGVKNVPLDGEEG
ncbi:MAG: DUF6471 domain-containing protein [Pseudomonadota bacterium]